MDMTQNAEIEAELRIFTDNPSEEDAKRAITAAVEKATNFSLSDIMMYDYDEEAGVFDILLYMNYTNKDVEFVPGVKPDFDDPYSGADAYFTGLKNEGELIDEIEPLLKKICSDAGYKVDDDIEINIYDMDYERDLFDRLEGSKETYEDYKAQNYDEYDESLDAIY